MTRFHVLDEASVVLRNTNGVYRQAKVFRRGVELYAGVSSGFLALHGRGGTSSPTVSWSDLDPGPATLASGPFGRPVLAYLEGPTLDAIGYRCEGGQ